MTKLKGRGRSPLCEHLPYSLRLADAGLPLIEAGNQRTEELIAGFTVTLAPLAKLGSGAVTNDVAGLAVGDLDRKSTRLNSSHRT